MGARKPLPTLAEIKQMSWKDYMKTRHWANFRKSLDTDDATCDICGKKKWSFYKTGSRKGKRKKKADCQFQCHHLHYNSLGEESREDVLYLCKTCHGIGHDLEMASRTRGGIYEKLYSLFCKVTPWEYTPFKDRNK